MLNQACEISGFAEMEKPLAAKKKTRIVRREMPDGSVEFVVQQKHLLFRWRWVDAWRNGLFSSAYPSSWPTLAEAQKNLWMFDGTKPRESVVG